MITFEKNIIVGDLLESFSWFHYLQVATGSSRIRVDQRIVKPPSTAQKCYTIILAIIIIILYCHVICEYLPEYKKRDYLLYLCTVGVLSIHCVFYLLNLIHTRFLNNHANVDFCMKMQKIDSCMQIDHMYMINAMLRKVNKVTVTALYVIMIMFSFGTVVNRGITQTIPGLTVVFADAIILIELAYCSNIMAFFAVRMRILNAIISNHVNPTDVKLVKSYNVLTKKYARKLALQSHDFVTCDTDVYLREILEGFLEFQKLYRFQMFLFCNKLSIGIILYFQILILGIKFNALIPFDIIGMSYFVIFNTLLAVFICIRCEIFLADVRELRPLCIAILAMYTEGPLREKAKRTLHVLQGGQTNFSIYEMWDIDANALIMFFKIATTTMVTQLQYAFL